MRSSFASFTTAYMGLRASQKALDIVGQNITNVNTPNYTRQTLDLVSIGNNSTNMYSNKSVNKIGYGVDVRSINQCRDPYLDIRYRNQLADVGNQDAKVAVLEELENTLDEIMKTGIDNQLSTIVSSLQNLAGQAGSSEFQNMVKSNMQTLANLLNQYSKELTKTRDDIIYDVEKTDVPNVNNILKQIAELNDNIQKGELYGSQCLELKDSRNALIDELSSFFNIDVQYEENKLTPLTTLTSLKITFRGKDGKDYTLIDHNKHAEIEFTDNGTNGSFFLTEAPNYSKIDGGGISAATNINGVNSAIKDIVDLNKQIKALSMADPVDTAAINALMTQRQTHIDALGANFTNLVVTNTGADDVNKFSISFKDDAGNAYKLVDYNKYSQLKSETDLNGNTSYMVSSKTDYKDPEVRTNTKQNITDNLKNGSFASYMDMLNSSGEYDDPPTATKGIGYYQKLLDSLAATFAREMNDLNVGPNGEDRPLFQAGDGSANITAGNIIIADGWRENQYGITTTLETDPTTGNPIVGANENVLKFISKFSESIRYNTNTGTNLFEGTFNQFFVNINATVGLELHSAGTILDNYLALATNTANSRDDVSSVSLDEEGISIIQYQKSYNAAARFMTTLDEALDTIINGMGRVGR